MLNKWIPCLCIIAIGFFVLGMANLEHTVARLEQKFSVVAFVKPHLAGEQIKAIGKHIEVLANVEKVMYISPEKALTDFTQSPDIAQQVQILGENPLPASFVIITRDPSVQRVRPLVNRLQEIANIEEVKYGDAEAIKLQQMVSYILWAENSIGIGGVFFLFLLLFYLYAYNVCAADVRQRKKIYGEIFFISLGGMAVTLLLLYLIFQAVLQPAGRFVFLSYRHIMLFVFVSTGLQLASLGAALFQQRRKWSK